MINVKELRHMTIPEIMRTLKIQDKVTVDLEKLGRNLGVSVLPLNLEDVQINGKEVICAFVTNERGNKCIFYSKDTLDSNELLARVVIAQAFARLITTGADGFIITRGFKLSDREKMLVYEMLMPEHQVRMVLRKLNVPTTYILAEIFQVPTMFVTHRLKAMNITEQIGGYNF